MPPSQCFSSQMSDISDISSQMSEMSDTVIATIYLRSDIISDVGYDIRCRIYNSGELEAEGDILSNFAPHTGCICVSCVAVSMHAYCEKH